MTSDATTTGTTPYETPAAGEPSVVTPAAAGIDRKWWAMIAGIVLVVIGLITAVVVAEPAQTPEERRAALLADPGDVAEFQARMNERQDRRKQMLQDLVQRRTAAMVAGDEAAWLADIDPARTYTVTRERMRFHNLRQLQPATFRILTFPNSTVSSYDKASPTDDDIHVRQVLKLGEDMQHSTQEFHWQVTVHDDRLVINSVDERILPVGQDAARNPAWDHVALRSARGNGTVVFSAQDSAWNPQDYIAVADRAAQRVRAFWGNRKGAMNFVVFLVDDQQFRNWFDNGGVSLAGTVGVATFPDMVKEDGTRLTFLADRSRGLGASKHPQFEGRMAGARIMLRMSKIKDAAAAEEVLVHEMGHALGPHLISGNSTDFGSDGAMNQPSWAIEGFARYLEHKVTAGSAERGAAYVRRNMRKYLGPRASEFPGNKDFYSGDTDRTAFNYEIGAAFFLAAEKAGGPEKAADLYVALTNNTMLTSGVSMFIDQDLKAAGLNPTRVWTEFRKLVG